jgi:hypothetical protein
MPLRVDRAVRRITEVTSGENISSTRQLHVRRRSRSRRRRVSRSLRPHERYTRRLIRAVEAGAREYLRRHDRSTRRRRDGWVRDMPRNLERAQEKMLDTLIP